MGHLEAPALIGQAQPLILAGDIGGTRTRWMLIQGEQVLGGITTYDTIQDYEGSVEQAGLTANKLAGGKRINAAGLCVAGAIEDGVIKDAGQLKAYGWCDMPFNSDMSQAIGIDPEALVSDNDTVAAAMSQLVVNRKSGGPNQAYIGTLSTGLGGAVFNVDKNLKKNVEPGHDFLEEGAMCGCKRNGCVEAHISGSGIFRKYGIKGEDLPQDKWEEVVSYAVRGHANLLERLESEGLKPSTMYYFGSVALRGAGVSGRGVIADIAEGLEVLAEQNKIPYLPFFEKASHGDDSGIIGARNSAEELLAA